MPTIKNKNKNLFLFTILIFIAVTKCQYTFMVTYSLVNGSVTYDGLFKTCAKEFANSKPCTISALEHGFWNHNIPASWYLRLDYNCVGFTTDSSVSMGSCIVSRFNIVTDCSCDMNIPICCYR